MAEFALASDAPEAAPTPERKLLIVEDDAGLQRQMRWALADSFDVHVAGDRTAALEIMASERPWLAVLDLGLPPDPNGASEGLSTLETIVATYPGTKVIIASGNEDRRHALRAISYGAYDFFAKPVDVDQLKLILGRAWQLHELEEENRRLTQATHTPLAGIIGSSPAILEVCRTVSAVAATDVSLLIMGESGTGKELIARALHAGSDRARGPFVAVNCAAIPENLLESELFGYERGAFTGAVKQTLGKVEQAKNGTLFLDEIGDMPASLQAKVLRFLQNRSFQRLGGREEIIVDVRIASATNRDLKAMCAQGTFREDLYFRLNEVSVDLPPLRARDSDVLMITEALLRKFTEAYKKGSLELSRAAVVAIGAYNWPGNVRELENRLKRAVVLAQGAKIQPSDLGLTAQDGNDTLQTLKQARQKAETDAIKRALTSSGNNLTHAARMLGVSRPTLYNLLAAYEIKV
jgi:two-component system NtrC family response regulator